MDSQGFSLKRSHSVNGIMNNNNPKLNIVSPQPLRKSPKLNAKIFEEIVESSEEDLMAIPTRRFHSEIVFNRFGLDNEEISSQDSPDMISNSSLASSQVSNTGNQAESRRPVDTYDQT